MKWYEIHDNKMALYRYLALALQYSGQEMLRAIEKPQDFEREFHEARRWKARREAMFEDLRT
jgi:hypothetical protein